MKAKPNGLGREYGDQFADEGVASVYHARPEIPEGVFDTLVELAPADNLSLLDLGCGTGEVAVPMSERLESVDAVDPSAAMLEFARKRIEEIGRVQNLRLIRSYAEDFSSERKCGLIVAANSIHWTDWTVMFANLPLMLDSCGYLVVVESGDFVGPWHEEFSALLPQFSTNKDFEPYCVFEELRARRLWQVSGEKRFLRKGVRKSVDAFLDIIHSRNGFSRQRMGESLLVFDDEVRAILDKYVVEGELVGETSARVVWGRPFVMASFDRD
ncbi:MAG: class I SAM-dependent methyltransferase [Verrucomicrobiota bacterium]